MSHSNSFYKLRYHRKTRNLISFLDFNDFQSPVCPQCREKLMALEIVYAWKFKIGLEVVIEKQTEVCLNCYKSLFCGSAWKIKKKDKNMWASGELRIDWSSLLNDWVDITSNRTFLTVCIPTEFVLELDIFSNNYWKSKPFFERKDLNYKTASYLLE